MKKITLFLSSVLLVLLTFHSCRKDGADMQARVPKLPEEVFKYDQITPGANGFLPAGNLAINNQLATLGRVLFYETQLSINNRVSCGSCHVQSNAFADRGAFSKGFENAMTTRNTPAIINPGTQTSYFWDMRENDLSHMVMQPISNHIEMGLDQPDYIVAKVKKLPYYEPLFAAAFGDGNITMERLGTALQNFVGAMVTTGSKYDEGATTTFANFSNEELAGKQLFTTTLPCAGCHGGESFSGWGTITQNIGLEMDYADDGQPGIDWMSGREQDGWFKVPSLRNIAITAPYMHDGRFKTLEEVVDFYDHGIQAHEQLSFSLREGWGGGVFGEGDFFPVNNPGDEVKPLRLHLTSQQKSELIAFMKTLSDFQFMSDVKFSDPFNH